MSARGACNSEVGVRLLGAAPKEARVPALRGSVPWNKGRRTLQDPRLKTERATAATRRYRSTLKGKAAIRHTKLKQKYGISLEEYNRLHLLQRGLCAICGKPESYPNRTLSVDHDHLTEKVRGLLCAQCNRGIGFLGDTPEALRAALNYLEVMREATRG